MKAKLPDPTQDGLPAALAAPARRVLAAAGIKRLEQLTAFNEEQLGRLNGIGPNALSQLHRALKAKGLSFAKSKKTK
jgi:hypothetical protein